jgi:hypothetical protein
MRALAETRNAQSPSWRVACRVLYIECGVCA